MRRFFLVLFIFLVACQNEEQMPPEIMVVITPEEIVAVENTSVPPTQIPTTTSTYTPVPSLTVTPTPVPTVEPTPSPTSDPFSIIASDEMSKLLKSRIVISEELIEDDVKLSRVSGWDDGFRDVGYCQKGAFQWLDESHLLLFPVVGKDDTGFGFDLFTRPTVLDLDVGGIWITPIANSVDCELPAWSDTMQSLIVLWQDEFLVLNTQGDILNRFPGRGNPFLSPSESKFFAYDTWYDLQTGEAVKFSKHSSIVSRYEERQYDSPPGWSDDETRLIRGAAWVDVKSGETQLLTWPKNDGFGHGGASGLLVDYPIHSINENLVLFSYPIIQDGELIVPLFDLRTNKIANIQAIVGIDPEITCDSIRNEDSLSFLVMRCDGIWYVIDPETLTMDSRFVPSANAPVFSPDDQYAVVFSPESQYFLWENVGSEFYKLDISPLATLYDSSYMPSPPVGRWSPDSNWFLFWTEEFEVLSFLKSTTKELISVSFPYANGRKMQEFWALSEDQVALLDVDGRDGSLWWVSDLSDDGDAELVNPPEVKFIGGFWQEDEQTLLLYDEKGRFWKFSFAHAQLEPITTTPFETIHMTPLKEGRFWKIGGYTRLFCKNFGA